MLTSSSESILNYVSEYHPRAYHIVNWALASFNANPNSAFWNTLASLALYLTRRVSKKVNIGGSSPEIFQNRSWKRLLSLAIVPWLIVLKTVEKVSKVLKTWNIAIRIKLWVFMNLNLMVVTVRISRANQAILFYLSNQTYSYRQFRHSLSEPKAHLILWEREVMRCVQVRKWHHHPTRSGFGYNARVQSWSYVAAPLTLASSSVNYSRPISFPQKSQYQRCVNLLASLNSGKSWNDAHIWPHLVHKFSSCAFLFYCICNTRPFSS